MAVGHPTAHPDVPYLCWASKDSEGVNGQSTADVTILILEAVGEIHASLAIQTEAHCQC